MSFCNFNVEKSEDDEDDYFFDDNSEDYNEYRTNSSSSSLKWSVDARKQNEEDWKQIESVLFGEESLPEDEKTKEEFSSWMERFPHLRVVGTKINLPLRGSQRVEYISNYEEVIAVDPAPQYHHEPFKMLDQELNEKLSLRKARQPSGSSQLRADDLEKLLRITSSSSGLSRNYQQPVSHLQNKKVVDRTSTFIVKQSSVGLQNIKKLSKIQEHKKFEPIIHQLDNKLSYSATSPYVKSVKSASKLPFEPFERQKIPKSEFSKSASIHHHKKLNQNNIQLPPFKYESLDFPSFIQVRGYNQNSYKFMKH